VSDAVSDIRFGYFGKYPGYRDFVQRGLPARFIDRWRRWNAVVMDTGNSLLGDRWLDVYLTSPVWRFALRDHNLGEGIWLGALMPSMDARQRYFPLCVVACLPSEPPFQLLRRSEPFLVALEDAMIATLQEPYCDTDDLAKHFDALWESSATDCLHEVIEPEAHAAQTEAVQENATQERQALYELDRFVARSNDSAGIWHAAQVARGNQCLKVLPSLPDPTVFVRLQESTVMIGHPPETGIHDAQGPLAEPPSGESMAERQ